MSELAEETSSPYIPFKVRRALLEKLNAIDALTLSGSFHAHFEAPGHRPQKHVELSAPNLEPDQSVDEVFADAQSIRLPIGLSARVKTHRQLYQFIHFVSTSFDQQGIDPSKMIPPKLKTRGREFLLLPRILARPASDNSVLSCMDINEVTKIRTQGHEKLVRQIYSIIREEAERSEVAIARIILRPEWSNEYENQTGVIMDIEIAANNEARFLFWDKISERLDRLLDELSEKERLFLANDISVVVTQG